MKTKKFKASVLVMSLLIMFAIVIITLSATLVSVRDRNISIGSGKSSKAFQTAQTGIEKTMKVLEDLGGSHAVSEIANGTIICRPDGLLAEGSIYTIELKKDDGSPIDCNSTTIVADISSIKSIGKEGDSKQRAIEAVMAADTKGGVRGGGVLKKDSSNNWDALNAWGEGLLSGSGVAESSTFDVCENPGFQDGGFNCGVSSYFVIGGEDYVSCVCLETT